MSLLRANRRRPALALAAALILGASLITASRFTADGDRDAPAALVAPSAVQGVPQSGAVLGDPKAPVTLVEYADLQCPYCAEWARYALPPLVDRYVRTGKVKMVFRGLAFLGPDSERALRAAVAAGGRNRLWNVVEGLYLRQGAENSGWVTESLLHDVAGGEVLAATGAPWVQQQIDAAASAAEASGVPGTPAFEIGRTGGRLRLVQPSSLGPEGLEAAIDSALRS